MEDVFGSFGVLEEFVQGEAVCGLPPFGLEEVGDAAGGFFVGEGAELGAVGFGGVETAEGIEQGDFGFLEDVFGEMGALGSRFAGDSLQPVFAEGEALFFLEGFDGLRPVSGLEDEGEKLGIEFGFPASRLPGFPASRLPGFPASRLPGFPASRLPGFPASRLPGFPASRLPGFHFVIIMRCQALFSQ